MKLSHLYTIDYHLRLDAIAEDAELQEKSEAELKRLIEYMKKACEDAVKEHAQKNADTPVAEGLFSRKMT